jgi:hypothetical protein
MRRRNPRLPPIDRRQSTAVNHVAKFVADELVLEPKAFLRLGALGRVYHDWVEFHGVMNRRVSANELLLRLGRDYNLTCGVVYVTGQDGAPGMLYGLRGARLRDPALNARGKYSERYTPTQRNAGRTRWVPVIEGSVPDIADRFAGDDDPTDDYEDNE